MTPLPCISSHSISKLFLFPLSSPLVPFSFSLFLLSSFFISISISISSFLLFLSPLFTSSSRFGLPSNNSNSKPQLFLSFFLSLFFFLFSFFSFLSFFFIFSLETSLSLGRVRYVKLCMYIKSIFIYFACV